MTGEAEQDLPVWLDAATVRAIHDAVLDPDNVAGEDGTRPIESVLARVEQRVHYGDLPVDVLHVGAAYAVGIAKAHAFIDGNKRTALAGLETFLELNGYQLSTRLAPEAIADLFEDVAGDRVDEAELRTRLADHVEVVRDDPDGVIDVEGQPPH